MKRAHNHSLHLMPVGRSSSAFAVEITSPAWPSLIRWATSRIVRYNEMSNRADKTKWLTLCIWTTSLLGVNAFESHLIAGETNNSSSFERGVMNFTNKDWKNATTNFSQALLLNPTNSSAFQYR